MATNGNMSTMQDIIQSTEKVCEIADENKRILEQLSKDLSADSSDIKKELKLASQRVDSYCKDVLITRRNLVDVAPELLEDASLALYKLRTSEAETKECMRGIEVGSQFLSKLFSQIIMLEREALSLAAKCQDLHEKISDRSHIESESTRIARKSIDSQSVRLWRVMLQAVVLILIYFAVGVMSFYVHQDMFTSADMPKTDTIVDALYFMVVTITTVGYGDFAPKTKATKMLVIVKAIIGVGFLNLLFSATMGVLVKRLEDILVRAACRWGLTQNYFVNVKKGQFKDWVRILVAIVTIMSFIYIGILFNHCFEDTKGLDSVYFSVISMLTIGYGDKTFQHLWGRILGSVWLLVGTTLISRSSTFLMTVLIERKQEHLIQDFAAYIAEDPRILRALANIAHLD